MHRSLILVMALTLLLAGTITADTPQLINYQGTLLTSGDTPVADDTYSVTFAIFDAASDGESKWSEVQSITTSDGAFSVLLGSVIPIHDSVFADIPRYLSITLDGEEMDPRMRLASVPGSFRTSTIDGTTGGGITGGITIAVDELVDGNAIIITNLSGDTLFRAAIDQGETSVAIWEVGEIKGEVGAATGNKKVEMNSDGITVFGATEADTSILIGPDGNIDIQSGGVKFNDGTTQFTQAGASNGLPQPGGTMTGPITNTGDPYIKMGKANFGTANSNAGTMAFVAGENNIASGSYATISGGKDNIADDTASTVGGGSHNYARGRYSVVAGGGNVDLVDSNSASGDWSVISGGKNNSTDGYSSTIGGGVNNTASWIFATVSGGTENIASDSAATVGGGSYNFARGMYSVVAGGGNYDDADSNSASGHWSVIGGGRQQVASGESSTIGGGRDNITSQAYTTVSGGASNTAASGWSTIAGGSHNQTDGPWSTIGGGYGHFIGSNGNNAVISGGREDTANGNYATVPGGYGNKASGDYSFAAGQNAKASHPGSWVWSDGSMQTDSWGSNTFTVRAAGGFLFYTDADTVAPAGVSLSEGGGAWETLSDQNSKTNINEVDYGDILEKIDQLPISEWNYKSQDESIRHIGPMAQDFHRLFGVGENNKHLSTIDPDGVALAAIKALNEKSKEVDELKQVVERLLQRVATLEQDSSE